MEYFQTSWRSGSAYNRGLLPEEYFYKQIYEAIEKNVENKTLPFFNSNKHIPIELSTGKIINDHNLVALEQIAAKNGYKSNNWIYGSELERLSKEGIKLNLKKGSEPVLCLQKLNNPIHVNNQELYISEAGTKSNYQFLYNIDSLDERSVKALEKHINTSKKIDNEYTNENFTNFVENQKALKKAPPLPQGLKRIKDKVISTCQTLNMNIAPLVDAQAKHVCYEVIGNRLTHQPRVEAKQNCYNACLQIIENTKANKTEPWKVGETITRALDAGTWYARSYTSKDFSIGYNKQKEEQAQKETLLKSKLYSGIER